MGNTLLCVLSLFLLNTLFYGKTEVSNKVTVTLQPNWPLIYRGEKITVRCEIQGGGGTEWEYQWRTPSSYTQWTNTDYWSFSASQSHSGDYIYTCRGKLRRDPYSSTEWSQGVTVTVSGSEPTATLTADRTVIPAGGRVTLTCSVDGSYGWKYSWFRRTSEFSKAETVGETEPETVITQGGIYTCRGGRGEPELFTQESNKVTVEETVSNQVTVTLQPNWPLIYRGEKITVRCEIQGGGDTEWTYEWRTPSSHTPPSHSEYWISRAAESDTGGYRCRGRSGYSFTGWSDVIRLTVSSDQPKATVTPSSTTTIPAGGRVTLTCSVDDSDDWRYDWFRRVSHSSGADPVRSVEPGRDLVVSEGGLYHCRGRRGDPEIPTETSNEVLILKTVSNQVTVTLQPNWPLIYRGEKITVRCEIQGGGDTEWTYEWRTPSSHTPPSHSEYRISRAAESDTGDYWCRGRSDYSLTEWSDVIRLTVSRSEPTATLTADRTVIPAGGRVTLTCSVYNSYGWKYSWFRRTSDSSKAETVGETDEPETVITQGGIYTCRGGRGEPELFTQESNKVTVKETVSNKVTVTLQPNWPLIYSGEKITVRCEIQGGGGTEWTYEWRTPSSHTPPSHSEYRISSVTLSHSGSYRCRGRKDLFSSTEWSDVIRLTVSSDKPRASMTTDTTVIPAGGRVTLTCSVNPSSGWKYDWYRDNKLSEPLNTHDADFHTTGQISVSQGGVYRCRGGRGDPVYYTKYSQEVRIDTIVPNRAVVTLQPDWTEIYRGERISVSCEIQGGGDTEWTYEWKTTSSLKPSNQHEYRISSASSSHSGEYRCRGRMKSARRNTTEWSAAVNLTVYDNKPRPVLTVSPSWLSPGASVTLKCEVEHPSAGWRFSWYKAVPDVSHTSYSYELLPGSSSGTEQDSYIVHGQTHTAGYVCEAGRGDPVFHTEISEPKFVWSGDVHPSASLTVSPDRVQHFIYDDISLNCEGNSTEWRVRRFPEGGSLSCSDWRRMTGSRCDMFSSQRSDAVYWCESGSGEFSNTVNITLHDDYHDGVILVSPVRPVTEGESVTLGCRFRTEKKLSSVFFYHNDKLIQSDTRTELNISAVSKSDEGFYKCQSSGEVSPQSWMSVKAVPRPESSSFPVRLILGLVCGIVLIVLLLLLYRCRQSKDLCFIRSIQSESTSSTTNHGTNQNESQHNDYASPLNGDTCIYDTIKDPEDAENGEPQDVTYSSIELKNVGKKHKHREPAETSVYSDIKTRPADNSPLYAQVNINTKEKAKKKKGKSTPAATDDSFYSEVKNPGTAFGL